MMRECKSTSIVKDYIMFQKESGYQSIHVIIRVRVVSFTGDIREVPVEIQFRNYTQHLFNECEHARYKNDAVFDEAKVFLLTVANNAYTEILDSCKKNGRSYFLIRED